eukprot:3749104-Alexandrium_andersonii.AAC.1
MAPPPRWMPQSGVACRSRGCLPKSTRCGRGNALREFADEAGRRHAVDLARALFAASAARWTRGS